MMSRFLFLLVLILLFKLPVSGQPDGRSSFEEGLKKFNKAEYEAAIASFEKASQAFQGTDRLSFAHSLYQQGNAYYYRDKEKQAKVWFDSALHFVQKHPAIDTASYVKIKSLFGLSQVYYYENAHLQSHEIMTELRGLIGSNEAGSMYQYEILAYLDQFMARNMIYTDHLDSARYFIYRTIDSGKKAKKTNILGESYNVCAEFYFTIGNLTESRKYLLQQYMLYKEKYGEQHKLTMRPTMHLGVLAYSIGDYKEAEKYIYKAYFDYVNRGDTTGIYYATILNNLADCYYQMDKNEQAFQFISKAISALEPTHTSLEELYEFYAIQSVIAADMGLNSQSREAIAKAEAYVGKMADKVHYQYLIKSKLAWSLQKLKDFDRAEAMALEVLRYKKKSHTAQSEPAAHAYIRLSEIYVDKGDYALAEAFADSALLANSGGNSPLQVDIYELMITLPTVHKNKEKLVRLIREGVDYLDKMRREAKGEYSRAVMAKGFYTHALEAVLADSEMSASEEELVFLLFEKSKSRQLIAYLKEAETLNTLGIDKDILNNKSELITQISLLEQKIEAAKEEQNAEESFRLQSEYIALNEQYADLLEKIKIAHPSYYQVRYDEGLPLKELQARLGQNDQQILTYHMDGDSVYGLLINSKHMYGAKLLSPRVPISSLIEQFRSEMYAKREIAVLAQDLYSILLSPFADKIQEGGLVIVPDELLALLPFEALQASDGTYLLEHYPVSYEYSATTYWRNGQTKTQSGIGKLLAMAPEFLGSADPKQERERSGLMALPGAEEEATKVSRLFDGTNLMGKEATETQFMRLAAKFDVLHLATHALIDHENSGNSRLIFSHTSDSLNDGLLYPYEIYPMNLQSALVTLSACNTGFGALEKGEGVASLSRAFAYAGCLSTLMSLWPVSDKTTPQIMENFYKSLESGVRKDEAIREAKLAYLSTAKGEARHPYYWAAFVINGDTRPLSSSSLMSQILGASALLVVIVLGFLLYRNFSNKASASS